MGKTNNWDLIITPHRGWFNFDLKNIWTYRDLIKLFVRRDIVSQYKQTIIGPFYFIITPILATIINMVIFGKIANLSTDGIPQFLFYMSGNLLWGYFASCLAAGKSIFQSNTSLFSKVYFPRLCVPISQNISALFRFTVQVLLFLSFYIYFLIQGAKFESSWGLFLIPLLILNCSILGLGTGILISSFTTKYKDINYLYNYISRFWFYITPVVYPLSVIPENMQYIASFNPMVGIIETSRYFIFGTGSVKTVYIFNGCFVTLIIFIVGLVAYNQVEKNFIDTI